MARGRGRGRGRGSVASSSRAIRPVQHVPKVSSSPDQAIVDIVATKVMDSIHHELSAMNQNKSEVSSATPKRKQIWEGFQTPS